MNLNVGIVDQWVSGIVDKHPDILPPGKDETFRRTAAFTILCMSNVLDVSLKEASGFLTDGGNDFGIDGIHIGNVVDQEFTVTLFQSKYEQKKLDGESGFPATSVEKAVLALNVLFDPKSKVVLNERLEPKVAELRSLIGDYCFPSIRFFLCNNGKKWSEEAERRIQSDGHPETTSWYYFNHDSLIGLKQQTKDVPAQFRLHGAALIDDKFPFRRVLVGKISAAEIKSLFDKHGESLLDRNVRRHLGTQNNRVNIGIRETLEDPEKKENFYFYNNGITVVCDKFRHNEYQREDWAVSAEGLRIINGGQTCKTIQQTLQDKPLADYDSVYVLLRLYELGENDQQFLDDITFTTNSQNPVDLRDLRSNDKIQKQLELGLKELGYTYLRKRDVDAPTGPTIITSEEAAAAILAVWRKKPHLARFAVEKHFGALYDEIFSDINPAQLALAVTLVRTVEKKRLQDHSLSVAFGPYVPYADFFVAMGYGFYLLKLSNIKFDAISHKNFSQIITKFYQYEDEQQPLCQQPSYYYYINSILAVSWAVKRLYGQDMGNLSLQRLAATFRRGDLVELIEEALENLPPMEAN